MGDESNGSTGEPRPDDGRSGEALVSVSVSPAAKSSLLWGLVGGLAFLVLVQGYELLADPGVGVVPKVAVALAVAVVAAGSTRLLCGRVPHRGG